MKQRPFYLKILVALGIGYFIASILTKNVFIVNSPRLRQNLGQYLLAQLTGVINNSGSFLANVVGGRKTPEQALGNVPLQQVAKGVYAKNGNGYSYTIIKENEVEWVVYKTILNGKQITIKIPKGQMPPP